MRNLLFVLCLSLFAYAKTDLTGNWVSECISMGKQFFKSRVVFRESKERVEFKLFEDSKCQEHSLTYNYEGSFITGTKFGEGKKFNRTPAKVQLSVHSPALLEQFNKGDSENGCGIKNWKLNTAQNVSGKFCRPFNMPTIDKPIYDIYKLNLNSLVFGGLPIRWDMSDPSVRPDKLSKIEFWIEKK